MENINDVKNRIKNKSNKSIKKNEKEVKPNKFKFFAFKFFVVLLVFCFASLACTKDVKLKNIIRELCPFQNIFEDKKVFNEKLKYKSISKYNKGVKLTLSDNYAIPIIKGGIVIFSGEKEGLGKTIIIQQSDGIDVWYSNLANTTMKLYDYVEDNAVVGEAKNNELYLIFQKDGVEIDSSEVLKQN